MKDFQETMIELNKLAYNQGMVDFGKSFKSALLLVINSVNKYDIIKLLDSAIESVNEKKSND